MEKLLKLVRRLRKECPWDRKQTLKTLVVEVIEEVYELNSSINKNELEEIAEELGDVLLGVLMMGVVLEEKGIDIVEVVEKVHNKMIKRHPHVFREDTVDNAEEVIEKWEKRKGRGWMVQRTLPALLRSSKIQKMASRKGFDWDDISGVYEKIDEELEELKKSKDVKERREELGDILFACAHLGNFLGINPEIALQKANNKFERRFRLLEENIKKGEISDFTIEELERIWQDIKNNDYQED